MANEYIPTHPAEAKRIELHNELVELLGTPNVYFQTPPPNVQMVYPAIVYDRSLIKSKYASDSVYTITYEYTVTVIDTDTDSLIVDKMSKFRTAKHIRHYVADELSHDVFKLHY